MKDITAKLSYENLVYGDKYPKVEKAKEAFSKHFGIPRNQFILTNGIDNALRIVLDAIGNTRWFTEVLKLQSEFPLSKHIQKVFDSRSKYLDITYIQYRWDETQKFFSPNIADLQSNIVSYITDGYNDLFEHKCDFVSELMIINEEYTQSYLRNKIKPHDPLDGEIRIGSFDHIGVAGANLGYVIYPEEYDKWFKQLEERFISKDAVKYILNGEITEYVDGSNPATKYDIPFEIVTNHSTYTTVKADALPIPHIKFTVNNTDGQPVSFCKFGNITNDYETHKEMKKVVQKMLWAYYENNVPSRNGDVETELLVQGYTDELDDE